MKTFYFSAINLWCSKNLVDLEFMIWNIFNLADHIDIKFFPTPENKEVEYIIINTCWFLSSSRAEAENTIKEFDDAWKKIIVMWCYTEVKDDEFLSNLKNLYAIIPHSDSKNLDLIFKNDKLKTLKDRLEWAKQDKLQTYLKSISSDKLKTKAFIWNSNDQRAYFNADFGYEFLKIAEWCDNNCTFCIIPNIRWRQKSRTIEDILKEIKIMINSWVKEIQIISQDTTRYGTDLNNWISILMDLLEEIDKVDWDFKYRLFYMYPDSMTFEHLDRLKNLKKLVPYFDIPFQHISPNVLKKMWRFYDENHIYKLLDYIKSNFKNVFLHTNFIVWFPGETIEDFELLKDFAKKYEFDSVSMFWYHDEPLATSFKLSDKVDDETIEKRVRELREILEDIYDKKYEDRVWKILKWFIHDIKWKKVSVRWEMMAPEIDEYDIINTKNIISWDINIWEIVEYKL